MRTLLLLLPLAAGCIFGGGPGSPFVRISVPESGRVYYARMDRAIHSESGGFLSFRDLVTQEDVKLTNGSYEALTCPREEISIRQQEYMENGRAPRVEDYR